MSDNSVPAVVAAGVITAFAVVIRNRSGVSMNMRARSLLSTAVDGRVYVRLASGEGNELALNVRRVSACASKLANALADSSTFAFPVVYVNQNNARSLGLTGASGYVTVSRNKTVTGVPVAAPTATATVAAVPTGNTVAARVRAAIAALPSGAEFSSTDIAKAVGKTASEIHAALVIAKEHGYMCTSGSRSEGSRKVTVFTRLS